MRYLKVLFALGLFALGFYSSNAQAAILYCFGCTPEQMANVAGEELLSKGIYEAHPPAYVINWGNGTVRKYAFFSNWTEDWDPEFDILETWFSEVPVEDSVQQNVTRIFSVAPTTRYVAYAFPGSAWDVVQSANADQQAVNWIHTQWIDSEARIMDYLNDFSFGLQVAYYIQVIFDDGSSAIYTFNEEVREWERRDGSAKDSNGNLIPEKRDDYARGGTQIYEFEGDGIGDAVQFYETARQWNIIIDVPPVANRFAYVCVDGGGMIVCSIQIL